MTTYYLKKFSLKHPMVQDPYKALERMETGDTLYFSRTNHTLDKTLVISKDIYFKGGDATRILTPKGIHGFYLNGENSVELNHINFYRSPDSVSLKVTDTFYGHIKLDHCRTHHQSSFLLQDQPYLPGLVFEGRGTLVIDQCHLDHIHIQAPKATVKITNSTIGTLGLESVIYSDSLEIYDTTLDHASLKSNQPTDLRRITSHGGLSVSGTTYIDEIHFQPQKDLPEGVESVFYLTGLGGQTYIRQGVAPTSDTRYRLFSMVDESLDLTHCNFTHHDAPSELLHSTVTAIDTQNPSGFNISEKEGN